MTVNGSKIRTVARIKRNIRLIWGLRSVCLALIMGVSGSLIGWGFQHHQKVIVVDALTLAVLTVAVMLLNWKLGD